MIRKILFLSLLLNFWFNVCGQQESTAHYSKWQLKPQIGVNIPITKLMQGEITDNLFQYNDNSVYWQILSVSYFWSKHFGVGFDYQASASNKIQNKPENFIAAINSEFEDNYFVNTALWNYETNLLTGDIQRILIGLIYRIETYNLYFYPKLSVGRTSVKTETAGAYLNEKNSHLQYSISYSSEMYYQNRFFTVAPSASFGYKILDRLFLNADIMLSYFKSNVEFQKESTNLYTQNKTVEYFDYKKDIYTLSLGAGIIFVIK